MLNIVNSIIHNYYVLIELQNRVRYNGNNYILNMLYVCYFMVTCNCKHYVVITSDDVYLMIIVMCMLNILLC